MRSSWSRFALFQNDFPSRLHFSKMTFQELHFCNDLTLQVEFVELPEEESEANESDNLVISHSEESEDHPQQGGGGEGLLEDNKVTFTL